MNEQQLLTVLRERLSPKRYEHSLNVAESAAALARKWGADEAKARYAGLAHDICKDDSTADMTRILEEAGYAFIDCERGSVKLLHAPAGAQYLWQSGLCADKEILDAVRYHTTGRAGMSLLEKIVYVADLISEDREYSDAELVRSLAFEDLDGALRYILRYIIGRHGRRGEAVHPNSVECLYSLSASEATSAESPSTPTQERTQAESSAASIRSSQ